jgi:two-component system, cell cycle response regulator DivK
MAHELILIIEDNEKNRKLARDVLQVKGYKTIESETAEEGLTLALEKSPALVLMDIQLPGMDGIRALKQLRANPTNEEYTCHCNHGISHDQQPADDVS